MKAAPRILVVATTLAALSTLGLAATAQGSVPPPDERPQQPTTTTTTDEHATVPHAGHGAQVDRDDAASATASPPATSRATTASVGRQLVAVLAVTLLGLLVALGGATWLRHRPPAAA